LTKSSARLAPPHLVQPSRPDVVPANNRRADRLIDSDYPTVTAYPSGRGNSIVPPMSARPLISVRKAWLSGRSAARW